MRGRRMSRQETISWRRQYIQSSVPWSHLDRTPAIQVFEQAVKSWRNPQKARGSRADGLLQSCRLKDRPDDAINQIACGGFANESDLEVLTGTSAAHRGRSRDRTGPDRQHS